MVLKENTSHGVRQAGVCEHSKTVIDGDDPCVWTRGNADTSRKATKECIKALS
jgi:hypothetical protein